MQDKKLTLKALISAVLMSLSASALCGNEVEDFFLLNGQIRAYDFMRDYGNDAVSTQRSFSLAGIFNLQTKAFGDGFGAGVSFMTAHDLGANDMSNGLRGLDTTLMGANANLNSLGQAYLQYSIPGKLLVRAGDQFIDSPWVNPSDSRALPATYQGLYAQFTPVQYLNIYAMDLTKWQSRTSDKYHKDNLYYPTAYLGDTLYGGSAAFAKAPYTITANSPETNGTAALGATYDYTGGKAQVWYYDFDKFARLIHGDIKYSYGPAAGMTPFVGAQVISALKSNALLGNVKAFAYGLLGGIGYTDGIGEGAVSLAYNDLKNQGASYYGAGAMVSPYTEGYGTDPFYTTSMIRGLVELGPGSAWKVKASQQAFAKQFKVELAYAKYNTDLNGKSNDTYLDLIYSPTSIKGFTIRNRIELSRADSTYANGNSANKGSSNSFTYERLMLTYAF